MQFVGASELDCFKEFTLNFFSTLSDRGFKQLLNQN